MGHPADRRSIGTWAKGHEPRHLGTACVDTVRHRGGTRQRHQGSASPAACRLLAVRGPSAQHDMSDDTTPAAGPRTWRLWALLGALWLGGVVAGLATLARVRQQPRRRGRARRRAGRPTSRLALDPTRPTLVMLAHPRCTCTRASLGRAGRAHGARAATSAGPTSCSSSRAASRRARWEQTDLWQTRARDSRRHGASATTTGVEAPRFGAETSGQTLALRRRRHAALQRRHDRRPRSRRRQRRPRDAPRAPQAASTPLDVVARLRLLALRAGRSHAGPRGGRGSTCAHATDLPATSPGAGRRCDRIAAAEALFRQHQHEIYARTDRMFAHLMALQWVAGIVFALWVSPLAWSGSASQTHVHVWAAVFLGGAISLLPRPARSLQPGAARRRATPSPPRRC